MLPAHLKELLTIAVDGELTHAERRMVDALLRESEEARVFHAQLTDDAEKLRNAPPRFPADDLASGIMAIITERGIRPTPLPMRRRHANWNSSQLLPWMSVATAAVVLIAVSIISYLFFATTQPKPLDANKESALNQTDTPSKTDPIKVKKDQPKLETPRLVENKPTVPEVKSDTVAKNNVPVDPERLPDPRIFEFKGSDDLHASPVQPEVPQFKLVAVSLTLLLPLKDLDQPYPKKQLRDELKKDDIFRLDLFCRDSTRAAELLQSALRSRGQQVIVESIAQDRLKKRAKTEYVFFTETLTAEEIALLLESLGAEDKKTEEKKAGDGQFGKFLLRPFVIEDANELSKLLGVKRDSLKLPKSKVLIDPRKSMESNTASQIASTLPKGSGSRNEKLTLVLPNSPFANPSTSKEIKSFLDKRGERRPGAVTLMIALGNTQLADFYNPDNSNRIAASKPLSGFFFFNPTLDLRLVLGYENGTDSIHSHSKHEESDPWQ